MKKLAILLITCKALTCSASEQRSLYFTIENGTNNQLSISYLSYRYGSSTALQEQVRTIDPHTKSEVTFYYAIAKPETVWLQINSPKQTNLMNWNGIPTINKTIGSHYVEIPRAFFDQINGKTFSFVQKDKNHFWSPALIDLLKQAEKYKNEEKQKEDTEFQQMLELQARLPKVQK